MAELIVNGTIYKITNSVNRKVYIGQTIKKANLRFNNHKYELRNNKHQNIHLQRAWNLYGSDKFKFEIIEINVKIENLDERESFWIKKLNSTVAGHGYNKTSGGQKHKIFSHESIEKIRKSLLGNTRSKGKKQNITDEERQKRREQLINYNKNRVFTEELKNKISRSLTGRKGNPQPKGEDNKLWGKPNTHSSRKIRCLNNNVIYNSITEAAKILNCDRSDISKVCLKKQQSIKGLIFEYLENKCLN